MPSMRATPGLRLVLVLALLPLAALPWLGQRFVETVAGVARDVQLDNLQVSTRGLAATLPERIDLLDPADGIGLPAGVHVVGGNQVGAGALDPAIHQHQRDPRLDQRRTPDCGRQSSSRSIR